LLFAFVVVEMWSPHSVIPGQPSTCYGGNSVVVDQRFVVCQAACQPTAPAVRLVVNVEPPDAVTAKTTGFVCDSPPSTADSTSPDPATGSTGYDWGQTYVRLRRASAMM
jgi:hypothetical protein